MRATRMAIAIALALGGGAVGASASAGAAGMTTTAPATTARPAASQPTLPGSQSFSGAAGRVGVGSPPATSATTSSTAMTPAFPPPPPPSVARPPELSGVPPTPAPATPGLPSPSSVTRVLPSSTGLGAQIDNERRPASSLSALQVADVQATLASGGLYRGPIDGILSGATRAAVQQFQAIEQLPATGELDGETLVRLGAGRSASTPTSTAPTLIGSGIGSGGTTSTSGNTARVDPFSGVPFPISTPLNTSPTPPAGTTIQP